LEALPGPLPLSTIRNFAAVVKNGSAPAILERLLLSQKCIESLDLNKAVSYLGTDGDEASWSRFDNYHYEALKRLEGCRAEVEVIASSTAHHHFEAIVRAIKVPVISILDAAAQAAAGMWAREVLIPGTAVRPRGFCAIA
jgi:aspartate/glutamate racemase